MNGFLKFMFKGNLVDLAVALVIGQAFTALVTAFVTAFITPLIGIFGGVQSLKDEYFTIQKSRFKYGLFVDASIALFITAMVLYFLIVLPALWVESKLSKKKKMEMRDCPFCFSSVKKKATRCAFCTSTIRPQSEEEDKEV